MYEGQGNVGSHRGCVLAKSQLLCSFQFQCLTDLSPYCLPSQHLEKVGDISGARTHYEQSGCALVEVTRMLYQAGNYDDLEAYITSQVDPSNNLIIYNIRTKIVRTRRRTLYHSDVLIFTCEGKLRTRP